MSKEEKELELQEEKEKKSTKTVEKEQKEEKVVEKDNSKEYLLEEYYRKKNQEKSTGVTGFKLFFVSVLSFVVGGIVMIGLIRFTPLISEVLGATSGGSIITKNETQVYEKGSLAASVDKIYDAVVLIECEKGGQKASSGTGFVYKVDDQYGYLLTNAHVVNEMEKVTVTFTNEEEAEVTVLGKDSYLDLAVLRVEKKYVSLISNIGSSENVKLGDTVFTVGSPMGREYRGSVTAGVLSGKDRMVSVSVTSSDDDWVMRVLQIDASINPGNSGGPLLNINGEVIGICSMKLVDSQIEGMGFAIPIEYAMSHVEQLEKGEAIERPFLGVGMLNTSNIGGLYKAGIMLPKDITEGAVVVSIDKDSAASKSDLQIGDVIIKLNDKKTKDVAYLKYVLYQFNAGDEVEITYIRDGKEKTTKVTLGKSS